ncbi:MAG TPA: copper resistance protein CopC [Paenibacillus sp.]|nr:copper resistance protein CopC [Paenibacillus sp.]
MTRRMRFSCTILTWALTILLWLPSGASAHASVLEATPAPNSRWDASPERIELELSAPPRGDLYALLLYDDEGQTLAGEASWSEETKRLSLPIPTLQAGVYTVEYRITSEDGHTVAGSYLFAIGDAEFPVLAEPSERSPTSELTTVAARIFHSVSLLLLVGWIFWGRVVQAQTHAFRKFHGSVSYLLQAAYAAGLLLMIGLQAAGYATLTEGETKIPLGSGFGVGWLISLLLAGAGLFLLHRAPAADAVWMFGVIAVHSYIGHSAGTEFELLVRGLGTIHTAAAAVWGGGLFLLVACWKKHRLCVAELLPRFSKAAMVCMGLLLVTGAAMALLVADPGTYAASAWGRLLSAKLVLVLGAIGVAAVVRTYLNRGQITRTFGVWLAAEFAFAVMIAAAAAALASTAPY